MTSPTTLAPDNTLMPTFTQRRVDPLALTVDDIEIEDIAHSLANLCRWNGHCKPYYSVAQHCVEVARWLQRHKQSIQTVRWGLMHDAAETYLGDISRFKPNLPNFDVWELYILQRVSEKFGLPWPIPSIVWEADDAAGAGELGHLKIMGPDAAESMIPKVHVFPEIGAAVCHIEAEKLFLVEWRRIS